MADSTAETSVTRWTIAVRIWVGEKSMMGIAMYESTMQARFTVEVKIKMLTCALKID